LLRIDNPPRNLLTLSMVADLAALVAELEKDDSVRSAVVTGEAPAHFSAGLDMREWSRLSPKAAQDEVSRGQDAFWAFEHLTKPRAAVKAIKRALTEGDEKPYRNRFLLESQHAVQLLWSDDYKAAMQKLRDKK